MIKLFNYRCTKCHKDFEILLTTEEAKNKEDLIITPCPCGGQKELFNFKNNKQTWEHNDKR